MNRKTEEEELDNWYDDTEKTFHAKVTGRHAITLPAALCRELEIGVGDTVRFTVRFGHARMQRADHEPLPDAYGILKGSFDSWEDVNRFVHEEREGWDDHETILTKTNHPSPPGDTSGN